MMKRLILLALIAASTPAHAGLGRWSVEVESDPFSNGKKIKVDYFSSIRSGVFIFCDTSKKGLLWLRFIPGYSFQEDMKELKPRMKIAVDGDLVVSSDKTSIIGSVGDNQAMVQHMLIYDEMAQFIDAFRKARKQVAFEDGMTDQPYLLSARGSTAAGNRLSECNDDRPE